uniref:Uncharacterized protein n=1 Tax=Pararge aegeria TaxID=116150 RepID=S4NZ39_9NEOP
MFKMHILPNSPAHDTQDDTSHHVTPRIFRQYELNICKMSIFLKLTYNRISPHNKRCACFRSISLTFSMYSPNSFAIAV